VLNRPVAIGAVSVVEQQANRRCFHLARLSGTTQNRQELELLLSFDTSLLWNRFCLVEVALVYGGRALPIAWKVLAVPVSALPITHPYWNDSKQCCQNCSICLLADRGFAHQALVKQLQQWGWHCIRAKADRPSGHEGNHSVPVNPLFGQAHLYEGLRLFEAELCSNLVSARPAGVDEPWAVLTDLPHVTNSELLCQQILHEHLLTTTQVNLI